MQKTARVMAVAALVLALAVTGGCGIFGGDRGRADDGANGDMSIFPDRGAVDQVGGEGGQDTGFGEGREGRESGEFRERGESRERERREREGGFGAEGGAGFEGGAGAEGGAGLEGGSGFEGGAEGGAGFGGEAR